MFIYLKNIHIIFLNINKTSLNISVSFQWYKITHLILFLIFCKVSSNNIKFSQVFFYPTTILKPKINSKNILNQFLLLLLSVIKSLFFFSNKIISFSSILVKKKKYTVLRSTFVHKTSRDQLQIQQYIGQCKTTMYFVRQILVLEYFNFTMSSLLKKINFNSFIYFITYKHRKNV